MSNTGTKESFLKRKNVEISFKRYGIDAMGAMRWDYLHLC